MSTSLLSSDLLTRYTPDVLAKKLVKFAEVIGEDVDDLKQNPSPLNQAVINYITLASEKTTDATRRIDRQKELIKAVDLL
jgi:hypothetical protein